MILKNKEDKFEKILRTPSPFTGEGWGEGDNMNIQSASPSPISPPAWGGERWTFYEPFQLKR
jgi:hypothetical protein